MSMFCVDCICSILGRSCKSILAYFTDAYWEIPPDSKVIEVVVEDKLSGNGCYIVGELTIESRLSEDELEEYYTSRYHPQYYSRFIDGDGIYVEPINNKANGDALYVVNVLTNWDCG
jgi:hypothetical protein